MTYKKIVEGLVCKEAEIYIQSLLFTNNISFLFTDATIVKLELDKYHARWEACVSIDLNTVIHTKLYVGGTIDEYHCYPSCVKNSEGKYIWYAVKETRELFGIDAFKI